MNFLRAVATACAALLCLSGCLQFEKVVKLKPDGSGTIEETLMIPNAAVASLQRMASAGGELEIFDEAKLQRAASRMGEGVTYVSGKKLSSDLGKGFTATYAFSDVDQLKLDENPIDTMPDTAGRARKDPIAFHFTKGNPAELLVSLSAAESKPKSPPPEAKDDAATQIMQQMLKDLKLTFAVEVDGAISETNAAYREGSRVTLLDMDMNKILADPEKFKAIIKANPQSMAQARTLLKGMDGIKIEASPEVIIKFQ